MYPLAVLIYWLTAFIEDKTHINRPLLMLFGLSFVSLLSIILVSSSICFLPFHSWSPRGKQKVVLKYPHWAVFKKWTITCTARETPVEDLCWQRGEGGEGEHTRDRNRS